MLLEDIFEYKIFTVVFTRLRTFALTFPRLHQFDQSSRLGRIRVEKHLCSSVLWNLRFESFTLTLWVLPLIFKSFGDEVSVSSMPYFSVRHLTSCKYLVERSHCTLRLLGRLFQLNCVSFVLVPVLRALFLHLVSYYGILLVFLNARLDVDFM